MSNNIIKFDKSDTINFENVQPLDRGSFKYYLEFVETNETLEIDEPFGINDITITLEQGKNKYAREISLPDSVTITLEPIIYNLGHQFEKVISTYKYRGFETLINLLIYDDTNFVLAAELRFQDKIKTNYIDYIDIPISFYSIKDLIENKKDIEVNILDNISINNKTISRAQLSNITLLPKNILEISEFSTGENDASYKVRESYTPLSYVFKDKIMGQIKESLTYEPLGWDNDQFYGTLIFTKQPSVITIKLKNIYADINDFRYMPPQDLKNGLRMQYSIAEFDDSGNIIQWFFNNANILSETSENNYRVFRLNYWQTTLFLPANTKISFRFTADVGAEDNDNIKVGNNGIIRFESFNVFPNLQTKSTSLYNVGNQLVKYLSDDTINFKCDILEYGRYKDIHALSGYLARGFPPFDIADKENLDNKPFITSFKDYEACLKSLFNMDWSIVNNELVFKHYNDYYQDIEAYVYPDIISHKNFIITTNEKLLYNKINFKYNKYKEDKSNTIDSVHTETSFSIPNSKLSNTYEIEVPYIADSYEIEYARREGLSTEGTTSKSDDDNIYLVDTIEELGIRTNARQQYCNISNVFSPETMYNLRLLPKRILIDNHISFISNICQKVKDGFIALKHLYFKNNGFAATTGNSNYYNTSIFYLEENKDISKEFMNYLSKPLITDKIYEITLKNRFKFKDAVYMINQLQQTNGYLTFNIDDGSQIKIYITKLEFTNKEESITIIGEEKYDN